jgi:uncharacterized membrane protein
MEEYMKKKKITKRDLTKKELLEMLLNREEKEIDEMNKMVDLLISKNITINVNSERDEEKTLGERMADGVAAFAGSWGFILAFVITLVLWILLNVLILATPFDKYPFILLNLILSSIAAVQAPIIMMSQNRQEKKDRLRSDNDYKIDLKAEFILESIYNKLNELIDNQVVMKKEIDGIKKHTGELVLEETNTLEEGKNVIDE